MKIKCAAIFICLFLAGLSQNAGAQELIFNSLLPPAPAPISIQNTQYLAQELQGRADVKDFFSDINRAKQILFEKMKPLTHFHNRLPCSLSAEPESIFEFSLPQLVRIYLIFEALENGNLVSQIGKIIEDHKEGNFYEPGGLGLLKNGQVLLKLIPSDTFSKTPGIEAIYIIPNLEFLQPHIFTFHMHPLGNSGPAPGPSWTVKIDAEAKEAKFDYDIGTALLRAKSFGDYHHLLISKMYKRYFNVDYYVAEKLPDPPSYDPSDYCGKLVGFKIIDLGVWRY